MTLTPAPDQLDDPAAEAGDVAPIDLRIVVDGASTAGKTTTARSLGERLGRPVTTPEETAGRTLLFDWMDHVGGRSEGRPIRTQVVSVPGHLPHLRARLLVTADVVLFVADTSPEGMPETRNALQQVHELLDAMPEPRPSLLIQANKRDHPDALPLPEVRRQLDLDDDELVIETVATEGDGVRQSYVYAVRLGLQHVRAATGPRVAERQLRAEDLLAELDTDPRTTEEIAADAAARAARAVGPGGPIVAPVAAPAFLPGPEDLAEVEAVSPVPAVAPVVAEAAVAAVDTEVPAAAEPVLVPVEAPADHELVAALRAEGTSTPGFETEPSGATEESAEQASGRGRRSGSSPWRRWRDRG